MAKISTIIEFKDNATTVLKKVAGGFDSIIAKSKQVEKATRAAASALSYMGKGDAKNAALSWSMRMNTNANNAFQSFSKWTPAIQSARSALQGASGAVKGMFSKNTGGWGRLMDEMNINPSKWRLPDNMGAFQQPKGLIENFTNGIINAQSKVGNLISKVGEVAYAFHPAVGVAISFTGQIIKAGTILQRFRGEIFKITAGLAGALLPSFGGLENIITRIGWKLQTLAAGTYFFKNIAGKVSDAFALVDDYVSSQAKIKNVKGELESVVDIQQMVRKEATRSRVPYQKLLDEVTTLKMTTGDAFADASEATKFMGIISRAFAVSGVGAEQASSSMLQLRQALSSGVLQGDELRSILEGAPLLARMLAENLGYDGVGAMKEAASKGALTTEKVIEGIMSAEEKIDEMFSKMPVRWSDVMSRIKTEKFFALQPLFEKISKELNALPLEEIYTKLGAAFEWASSKGIEFIDRVKWIADVFKGGDTDAGVTLLIKSFSGALTFLFGVLKGGNVGLLFQVVGALKMISQLGGFDATNSAIDSFVGILDNFSNVYPKILSNLMTNLTEVFGAIKTRMPDIMEAFSNAVVTAFNAVTEHAPTFIDSLASTLVIGLTELNGRMPEIGAAATRMLDKILETLDAHSFDVGTALGNLAGSVLDWFNNNYGSFTSAADSVIKGFIDGLNSTGVISKLTQAFETVIDSALRGLGNIILTWMGNEVKRFFTEDIPDLVGGKENAARIGGINGDLPSSGSTLLPPSFQNPKITPVIQKPTYDVGLPETITTWGEQTGKTAGQKVTEATGTTLSANMPQRVVEGLGTAQSAVQAQAPLFDASGKALGTGLTQGYGVGVQPFTTGAPVEASNTAGTVLSTMPSFVQAGNALGKGLYLGWMVQHPVIVAAARNTTTSSQRTVMKYTGIFFYAGYQLSAGIASGVTAGSGLVQSAVRTVINRAAAAARAAAQIKSPSKLMDKTVGFMLGAGVTQGIYRSIPLVENAAQDLVRAIERNSKIESKISVKTDEFKIPDKEDIERELSEAARDEVVANARIQYVNRYTQMHTTPSINFGDVHETADVNAIISRLAEFLTETYQADLEIIG